MPKRGVLTPEGRAILSARMKARWASPEREALMARAMKGVQRARHCRPKMPKRDTVEWKLFHKIARVMGAAAARAEIFKNEQRGQP